ncbi:hypothetical protein [Yersinia rohdei]|uniref:hypothetical protein n=1 Tax=Yersinia rohdei TaxID=29485 RepID=UPI0025AB3C78|nr:hypothetical protein [Yersinia rohdei]MDN0096764.1 hypothetical protein [Yersinia rohdei]
MKTIKKTTIALFLLPIIFGCQLKNKTHFIEKSTINKITALTSSIHFLKEECNNEGLPSEAETISAALRMMGQNKSDISTEFHIEISSMAKIRYAEIKSDILENDIKCRELENLLSNFIIKINN